MPPRVLLIGVLLLAPKCLIGVEPGEILPKDAEFDPHLTTPEQYFGCKVGQRHLYHHELVGYFKLLASSSGRVTVQEYARSYGGRPLILLTITSPRNHQQLESIRRRHLQLVEPSASADLDVTSMPAIVNLGYSVHGNEPSAGNAAPLVAYYLAAHKGADHQRLLDKVIVLLDPCLNPDGFERFAHWANNHRGAVLNPDPNHREHREPWPNGRTNYYWFDLNRDWLPVQHPESQGRLEQYYRWRPNVVLDFHEMNTNATYFFQPGVARRNHPRIPRRNLELTRRFAEFHAEALDAVGSLYFTEELFDDFYVGKGSTYPDLHGAVGILFEQASARGHVQDSVNGPLSFAHGIRNHFLTSLSSLRAALDHRPELLDHLRTFYQEVAALARAEKIEAYVVAAPGDPERLHRFLDVLRQHQIQAFELSQDVQVDGNTFQCGSSFVVPIDQPEYRFLKALFEKQTEFEENIFYDVSTWTLPLAFNIQYAELTELSDAQLGKPFSPAQPPETTLKVRPQDLAYVVDWRGYLAPKILYQLLAADIKVKVAMRPFHLDVDAQETAFGYGTLLIPLGLQPEKAARIKEILTQASCERVQVHAATTGLTPHGIDFGSSRFVVVPPPKLLLITGTGVSSYQAGEIWHLLDQRFEIPVTLVDSHDLNRVNFGDYSVVIMASGSYAGISATNAQRLERYLIEGGSLVAIGTAIRWLDQKEIVSVEFRKSADPDSADPDEHAHAPPHRRPYAEASRDAALHLVRGAIGRTHVDQTHPIGFGFGKCVLPVFRNNIVVLEPAPNPYSTPVVYDDQPLLSGYVSRENLEILSGSASVVVRARGSGRAVLMAEDPNFRGFWLGTNRLFFNALFFAPITTVP